MLSQELLAKVLAHMPSANIHSDLVDYDALLVLTTVQPQFNHGPALRHAFEQTLGGSLPLATEGDWIAEFLRAKQNVPSTVNQCGLSSRFTLHLQRFAPHLVGCRCTKILDNTYLDEGMIWAFIVQAIAQQDEAMLTYFLEHCKNEKYDKCMFPWKGFDVRMLSARPARVALLLSMKLTLWCAYSIPSVDLYAIVAWFKEHATADQWWEIGQFMKDLPQFALRVLGHESAGPDLPPSMLFIRMLLMLFVPAHMRYPGNNRERCPLRLCATDVAKLAMMAECEGRRFVCPVRYFLSPFTDSFHIIGAFHRYYEQCDMNGFQSSYDSVCLHSMFTVGTVMLEIGNAANRYTETLHHTNLSYSELSDILRRAVEYGARADVQDIRQQIVNQFARAMTEAHAKYGTYLL